MIREAVVAFNNLEEFAWKLEGESEYTPTWVRIVGSLSAALLLISLLLVCSEPTPHWLCVISYFVLASSALGTAASFRAYVTSHRLPSDPGFLNEIDVFLIEYTPHDEAAFTQLQAEAALAGQVTYAMLKRWLDLEREAIRLRAAEQSLARKRAADMRHWQFPNKKLTNGRL